MYELKKIGKVFTSKFVGTGPSSYKKRIYRAAVSQRLRNTVVESGRPQMTIWRMGISCWILKATNKHSQYVILTAFPLQN